MKFEGKSKLDNIFYIDNHTHGAFGVNFNSADYKQIKYLLKKLYEKNIRGICPTLVGDSACSNIQAQLEIFKKIRNEQLKNPKKEALILGVHLEGSFLSEEKSGIQDKSVFLAPTVENFKKLAGCFEDIIKIVTIAPEKDIDLIDYLNEKNIKTQAGHSSSKCIGKCIATTHHFNAMPQIHHREKSLTLEGLIRDDIYCEIIADLIHCSRDILELFLKIKPQDKIMLISDSLPSSNYGTEVIFCNKKIINGKDEKGTLAGSNQTLDEICKNLINKKILSREDIIQMAFKNQIKYLNLESREIDILNQ